VGFPIRKSTDQRVFAPPRSLSQRITSFIACACQGIHQLPLRHLIILIANAHPGRSPHEIDRKDQLLEICSLARLGNQSRCRRLSVADDEPSDDGTRTNLLFTMSNRTGSKLDARCKPFWRMTIFPLTPGNGGAGRDRTDDILLAKQALSQLSYGP
jgi:hypothetical protein